MREQSERKLPPVVRALLLQIAALLLSALLLRISGFPATLLNIALTTGLLAAALSHYSGMARWWIIIQLLFAPALVIMSKQNLQPAYYLAAFLLLALIYWSTFRSQVPLYLSSKRVRQTLEELLPPAESGKRFSFIDIGSGTGGVIIHLAKKRPDGVFVGIENAPLPFVISWLRTRLSNCGNCQVLWGSFWEQDFTSIDLLYAYLSPVPMSRLWDKASKEMQPGSLMISNTFSVADHPASYSITLDDLHHSTLHIWEMQS